jgi:hypothetical protein
MAINLAVPAGFLVIAIVLSVLIAARRTDMQLRWPKRMPRRDMPGHREVQKE